ncbi:CHAT domain-containing protein [Actinoplanes sp. NPDC049596]|uniref:CHAT domain-containing protein n=1 Tax=unclassified Actinoplanes TaxID=2626549 RepID=UPI00341BA196
MRDQFNTAYGGNVYATRHGDITVNASQPTAAGERVRVLMLAANPARSSRLAIDEEARLIGERLRLGDERDAYELVTCWAVRPMDLLQYLNQHRPQIVHFSGHGDRDGQIVLAAGGGREQRVSADALGELFRVANHRIRVVLLNACWSAGAVRAIGQHVDYVIGMTAPISDEAATVFAAAFYLALGFRCPVPQAFDQAVAALAVHGLAGRHIPELLARPGASPHLTEGPR